MSPNALAIVRNGLAVPRSQIPELTLPAFQRAIADAVPKGLKWKTRARVGERVRWYELPEEVDH